MKGLKNENERESNKYNKEIKVWEQEEAKREFWEKLSNEYRDIKGKIYKLYLKLILFKI